ncbi:MAG: DEAD/DEAH box helicase, partial [Peptostreptococcaceae bacterium]
KEIEEMTKDLIELYAKREKVKGYKFAKDTHWQSEFEAAFPHQETEDQLKAIQDTKKDMESTKVMDRLICGDVGYGKTEVAIRAVFKACMEQKQTAILVPTTILAQQHYNTFRERFENYPIRVEVLSRFKTPKEQRQIIEDARKGLVDVLIGTHRIISKDINLPNLGLVVIDE